MQSIELKFRNSILCIVYTYAYSPLAIWMKNRYYNNNITVKRIDYIYIIGIYTNEIIEWVPSYFRLRRPRRTCRRCCVKLSSLDHSLEALQYRYIKNASCLARAITGTSVAQYIILTHKCIYYYLLLISYEPGLKI